jgi:glycosyltransferase involved in cell wall biosynthesis
MELLRQAARHYGVQVEIVIFGISLEDPNFAELPHDFAWTLAGILTQPQIAALLNEADIFVDFSSHQAMGLTALEAMACGAAVVVPACGGAVSFARHEENSLVVDTASPAACWQAMQRLVEDHQLRTQLQQQALLEVCQFFPERAAFNILASLFKAGQTESL